MVWRVQCLILITVMAVSTVTPQYDRGYTNQNQASSERIVFDTREVRSRDIDTNTGRKVRIQTRLGNINRFNSSSLQMNKRDADAVVFPGPTSSRTRSFTPQVTDECLQLGYCRHVPNYPTEHVKEVLNKYSEITDWLQMDTIDIDVQIAQRLGGTPDQKQELCDFSSQIVHPFSAPDQNNEWYTVINDAKKPLQGFLAELCNFPPNSTTAPCSKVVMFQPGYSSSCEQKHVYRKVAALDKDGKPIVKSLKLPSCCSCVATRA